LLKPLQATFASSQQLAQIILNRALINHCSEHALRRAEVLVHTVNTMRLDAQCQYHRPKRIQRVPHYRPRGQCARRQDRCLDYLLATSQQTLVFAHAAQLELLISFEGIPRAIRCLLRR